MNSCKKSIISYHTFIFPFLWKIGVNKRLISVDEFSTCLNPGWFRVNISEAKKTSEFYAKYRYFNSAARNAIFDDGGKNSIVRNYRFDMSCLNSEASKKGTKENEAKRIKDDNNPAKLIIKKVRDEGEGCTDFKTYEYTLRINGLQLKLFSSGIGMLVYELENYDYNEADDINRINDFGRRLYMPYRDPSGCCDLCADTIKIGYDKKEKWISEICSKNAGDEDEDNIKLPSFVTNLLTNGKYTVTTDPNNRNTCNYLIEPIIGDRMFVACYYINEKFATDLSEWKMDEKGYRFLTDAKALSPYNRDNLAVKLYKFIFIDGNGLSCYSRDMLECLLKEHTYFRWIEKRYNNEPSGTITGITEYSMMSLTASDSSVVSIPFLTEYIEMAMLALAQRASILVFERFISDSALKRQDISKIQEQYILFQSQLLLQEVTPEQQGIEMYNELVESLFIERDSQKIENQISSLFELKNYKNDKMESFILFILAMLGITDAVNCIADWVNLTDFYLTAWLRFIPSIAAMGIGLLLFLLYKKKK